MSKVIVKRSRAVEVTFPDGSALTMQQSGDPWEGMVSLRGGPGQSLIVDVGFSLFDDIFAEIFGGSDREREAMVIKGSDDLLARLIREPSHDSKS